MHYIFRIFLESFPLEDDKRVQFYHSVVITLAVVLAIFLFQPFGLANISLPVIKLIPVYIGYAFATMIACLVNYRLIRPAFPSFFDDQHWTVIKHILWTVATITNIGLFNLFYSRILGFTGISGTSLLTFLTTIVVVSIIPVTIVTLIRRVGLFNKNRKIVKSINETLEQPIRDDGKDVMIVFNSESGNESIRLQSDQFLYAESSDHYTDIVYVENMIVRRALIHSSLKKIEEGNKAEFVMRVHRAFLVNMFKVKAVTGNAQGFRLIFDNLDETIPVARKVAARVKEILFYLHGS